MPKVKKKDKPQKGKKRRQEDALEDFDLTEEDNDASAESSDEEEINGDNGDEDYSTEITQEGIKTATESRAGLFLFFKADGDRYIIQFLNDLTNGVKVWRHEDYQRSVRPATCLRRVYKKPCPLCVAGIGGGDWFAWNVLDLKEKKVKILALKGGGAGGKALRQLAAEKKENGTLLGATFILTQEGTGQKKQITVTKKDLDPDTAKKVKKLVSALAEKKHDLMEMLKPRGMPTIQAAKSRDSNEAIAGNNDGSDDEFQIE